MKTTEIRELTDAELAEKLKAMRAELFNMRFRLATGQLDNTGKIAFIKKDIARLHTELRARAIAAQRDAAAS
ncbi:MAG: 50S ribosomal protein L29 [Actinobacteria bacterium HGW-Actinobacteria-7]|jgi:large subunit ribosomal protein L29|nr:MAG: 50S ribosomal protein L29 [Actinobacteria bacterium HGW-Actinobacteria-7]